MNTLPYQQAFERIRAEFLEMPGMRLTPEQVQRLSGVESVVCKSVLDDLVRARFLSICANGTYSRATDASTSRISAAPVDWDSSADLSAARRAS
jgi:hypothetical protein